MDIAAIWTTLNELALSSWTILYDSAIYLIIGFALSGLIHEYVPAAPIIRHLGGRNLRSVLLAAILGTPVPLCSCSVLPAAIALYRKGASRPAIASFLISVPETGIDSIAITYGLMGPLMAIYRPLAGVAAAFFAGLLTILVGDDASEKEARHAAIHHHDHHDHDHHHHGDHHGHDHSGDIFQAPDSGRSVSQRLAAAARFGFRDLFDEIAFWITAGLILSGLLLGLVPRDFFISTGWDRGIAPMLAMALLSIPVYTCASMSTPVAVGLIAAGLSPGAALVFLLTGPATNISTLVVMGRIFGARLTAAYLGGLLATAIAAGLLLETVAGISIWQNVTTTLIDTDTPIWAAVKIAAVVILLAMTVLSARRGSFRNGYRDFVANMKAGWAWAGGLRELAASLPARLDPELLRYLPHLPWRKLGLRAAQVAGAALAVWAVIALSPSIIFTIETGQTGLVQRFGAVVARDLEPGWHMHLPAPLGQGVAVETGAVRQLSFRGYSAPIPGTSSEEGEGEAAQQTNYYLTSDENEIDLEAIVQYRVKDAYRAGFGVESAPMIITDAGRQVLTALALEMPIDAIYSTGRLAIEDAFDRELARRVSALDIGYEIIAARLTYIHAPGLIHEAFRDVASATEDRTRAIFEAEGQRVVQKNEAAGRATVIENKARIDAMTSVAQAKGRTAGFATMAAIHDADPKLMEDRLRLEALERALLKPPKIIDGAKRAAEGTDLWLERGTDPFLKYRVKE